ncbi:MAG: GNAT family N-acetyltransferase [Methylococcaceae bacterium]|nr:GNAT family N-acetyltransferase [Methylococcaceae bacterium]
MVTLRDYELSDVDRLVCLAGNENVSKFLTESFPCPYTRTDAERWINKGSKQGHLVAKVIEFKGEFVGGIGLQPQGGWKQHMAEVGYWLGEQYWGRGIAPEALAALTETAFSSLGYKKVFAQVLGPNETSMRVLEKCGYRLEGVLEYEVFKSGQFYDVYQYASYRR